jgi:hypothetical protein
MLKGTDGQVPCPEIYIESRGESLSVVSNKERKIRDIGTGTLSQITQEFWFKAL